MHVCHVYTYCTARALGKITLRKHDAGFIHIQNTQLVKCNYMDIQIDSLPRFVIIIYILTRDIIP